jgi:hypothetical protein
MNEETGSIRINGGTRERGNWWLVDFKTVTEHGLNYFSGNWHFPDWTLRNQLATLFDRQSKLITIRRCRQKETGEKSELHGDIRQIKQELRTGSLWRRQSQQSFNTVTPFYVLSHSLHVSAPTGHLQVRYTIRYFLRTIFNTTDPLHVRNLM